MKNLLLIAFIIVVSSKDPPIPMWGGCKSFTVKVNMTDVSDSPEHPHWDFNYSYMSDTNVNQTYSRYEHEIGQYDEVCKGVMFGPKPGTSACIIIHSVNNNWMYLKFPETETYKGLCCKCS